MEGRQNNEEPKIYILTDDSSSQDTSNTPSFPTIQNYNGSEQDTDVHNILETNLKVSYTNADVKTSLYIRVHIK